MNANANPDGWIPVVVLAIVFGSMGIVMLTAILTTALTLHFRRMRACRLGSELIHEMLQRKFQPDEIERILALWMVDRRLAKQILGQQGIGQGFVMAKAS